VNIGTKERGDGVAQIFEFINALQTSFVQGQGKSLWFLHAESRFGEKKRKPTSFPQIYPHTYFLSDNRKP
jgi:hypothetical protein